MILKHILKVEKMRLDFNGTKLRWTGIPNTDRHGYLIYYKNIDNNFDYIFENFDNDGKFYGVGKIYGGRVLSLVYSNGIGREIHLSSEEVYKMGRPRKIKKE